jgi:cell wall assembly regulator SMI1
MSALVDSYIQGLLSSYNQEKSDCFKLIKPASDDKIELLQSLYPNIPSELISLLKKVNGSEYPHKEYRRSLDFFQLHPGCDDETRYEFCTIDEMLSYQAEGDYSWLSLCWNETSNWDIEDVREMFDETVNADALIRDRILFARCDYSELYIDFNPSEDGIVGQIVAYIHDPDSYFQLAESLSEYLERHLDCNFDCFNFEETEEVVIQESDYVRQIRINALNECINSINSLPKDVSTLTVDIQSQSIPKGELKNIFSLVPRSVASLNLKLGKGNLVELADAITALPLDMKSLDLSGNSMGNRIDGSLLVKMFSNIPPQLSSLYLHENALNHIEGDELALALKSLPQNIELLDLGFNHLGCYCCKTLKVIFNALPRSVTSLSLRCNFFEKKTGNELAYIFSIIPENVKILNLRSNSLHTMNETEINEALKSIPVTVTQIDLKWNGLKEENYLSSPTRIFLF